MERPPRGKDESLFAGGGWNCTCFYGILIAAISIIAFLQVPVELLIKTEQTVTLGHIRMMLENAEVLRRGQTYAFTVLGMAQLFHAVGMRDVERSLFRMNHLENRLMILAVAVGISLQVMVTEITGLIQVFGTCRLNAAEWCRLLILAAMPLIAHELLVLLASAGSER
jgi:Ca2+-transporting ATPase